MDQASSGCSGSDSRSLTATSWSNSRSLAFTTTPTVPRPMTFSGWYRAASFLDYAILASISSRHCKLSPQTSQAALRREMMGTPVREVRTGQILTSQEPSS